MEAEWSEEPAQDWKSEDPVAVIFLPLMIVAYLMKRSPGARHFSSSLINSFNLHNNLMRYIY